ncbi:uncharacterized protein At4g02000-like [Carya illinoinensis]|uniref:uncharacterized protein At4g02000-like n=1 Tax=Carya illinoinensis TaxID=32201 RepID=UPI001C728540|nr:uncharacterized protein At4g02000-like [Carya illinoinensis]
MTILRTCLKRIPCKRLKVQEIRMIEADFWVWIHDLPLMVFNDYVERLVGESLGQILDLDLKEDDLAWGGFLRIRIRLDISKPLLRRKKVLLGDGQGYWVRFTYERLSDFYYQCGHLGHGHRDCDVFKQLAVKESSAGFLYGRQLRATQIGLSARR